MLPLRWRRMRPRLPPRAPFRHRVQDLPKAMPAAEVAEKLGLHALRGREWHIHACCATNGDGLYEGLDWLSAKLK